MNSTIDLKLEQDIKGNKYITGSFITPVVTTELTEATKKYIKINCEKINWSK